jgi:hypothetical protein
MNNNNVVNLDAKGRLIYKQWLVRRSLEEISLITNTSIEDVNRVLHGTNKAVDSFEKTMTLLQEMDIFPLMKVPKR